jgi:hypothetical protein
MLLSSSLESDPSTHRLRLHADVTPLSGSIRLREGGLRNRSISFGRSSIGLGVGGRITPWLWLGGRLSGSGGGSILDLTTGGTWRSSAYSIAFSPYAELRPLPGRLVQPYIMAQAHLGYSASRTNLLEPTVRRSRSLGGGGAIGVHAFVLPRVSLDTDVGASFLRRTVLRDPHAPVARSVGLAARVGVSVWW